MPHDVFRLSLKTCPLGSSEGLRCHADAPRCFQNVSAICPPGPNEGLRCVAEEAVAAGAKGLVHIRLQPDCTPDTVKQLQEALSEQQSQDIITRCKAGPVIPLQYIHTIGTP